MKNLLLSFVLFVSSISVFAATRTVSNRPGDLAEFTSIQAAVDASADGDILLITGSATSYNDVTINKRLTLIGPGANPNFNGGASASISTLTFDSSQASNSVLLGLDIGTVNISVSDCDAVQLKRNRISYILNSSSDQSRVPQNWLVEECNINGSGIQNRVNDITTANWNIRNSYIVGPINMNGSIFSNNVFYYFFGVDWLIGRNHVITNSIFINITMGSLTDSSIANSIFTINPNINLTTNSSSGNFFETDPLFVSFSGNDLYNSDLSLQPSSVGINAGTDGTDIGLFGGKGFLVSGLPGIPQVESLVILNPNVPQNGTLNIKVDGKANN
ncbi:hypothetical protein SAMN00777080_3120 [Aquiflexum balticum DSM 16537]|uniref:Right handed beta helix region n=1 Tax=Aquiflexum balticum DSM 16537 TaxID=758820 RepID=A0A1W2H786_9BACT|nr:hypothetical protein [Aquiflexum balticum]SMD44498.1 hypothetical protein SAMN00777080_3120 [Aquiflexum balticum DSM 16537]